MLRARHAAVALTVVAGALSAAVWWRAGQPAKAPAAVAVRAEAAPAPAVAAAPRTSAAPGAMPAPAAVLRITLTGLQRGRDGRPIALLDVNGSAPRRFTTGDAVSVGVRLQRIERDAVVLQRGRVEERLALPPGAAVLADAAPGAARPPESAIVAVPLGQAAAPPSAIDRAIARARSGT